MHRVYCAGYELSDVQKGSGISSHQEKDIPHAVFPSYSVLVAHWQLQPAKWTWEASTADVKHFSQLQ